MQFEFKKFGNIFNDHRALFPFFQQDRRCFEKFLKPRNLRKNLPVLCCLFLHPAKIAEYGDTDELSGVSVT